jgi:UDP-N-acetylglucosamine 2-epimerase (non-hydrolysing)
MKITFNVGARQNFMKIAPIIHAFDKFNGGDSNDKNKQINYRLVHTGQHYDQEMSGNFFTELNIPTGCESRVRKRIEG